MVQGLKPLLSAGIDIGSTTTQVAFSRLVLENLSSGSALLPSIRITNATLLYMSPVHFTPFKNRKEVDFQALENLIEREYAQPALYPLRLIQVRSLSPAKLQKK